MADLHYRPKGVTGYVCELTSAGGATIHVRRKDTESSPDVSGDDALIASPTLVAALESFADNELAGRRARDPRREKLFARSARESRQLVTALADLLDKISSESRSGWCSACLTPTDHYDVDGIEVPPTRICSACGSATTPCVVPGCEHFAVRSTSRVAIGLWYCAEHAHDIPAFERLDATLPSLDAYESWLEFDRRNARRITQVVGGAVTGALIVSPAAFLAAPAIGGAIGTWTGLSGAAATSHGLALLGGGAVSAGGFGIAGGTAVVAAVGAALGTAKGASVTTAYVSSDPSFAIELVEDGEGTPVVFATGFLTEGEEGWGRWERLIRARYPEAPVYRVRWGAKELKTLRSLLGREGAEQWALKTLGQRAISAGRASASKIGVLGHVLSGFEVAKNPWHVARTRAEMTGAVLADLIARTETERFVLIGHSLGARVMMSATEVLATKSGEPRLADVHLLGAAINSRLDLRRLEAALDGGMIHNYWSRRDPVLRRLYRSAELGTQAAGAVGFTHRSPVVKNHNVSPRVDGHSAYLDEVRLSRDR